LTELQTPKNPEEVPQTHVGGFAIDEAANYDAKEEDDNDLALAALESLDAH
jgi:hypothetical protein